MNIHSVIKEEMKILTTFKIKLLKWLDEFFFGPEDKKVRDPNKVISITDYNTEILKRKKDSLSTK